MSRYLKIRHFFETIVHQPVADETVALLARRYSAIVRQQMIESQSVRGSLACITSCSKKYDLAIISGSDQDELREVCEARGIAHYFVSILGSPPTKEANFLSLFKEFRWKPLDCVYIGDSLGDYHAAKSVSVDFIARRSGIEEWKDLSDISIIDDLSQLVA